MNIDIKKATLDLKNKGYYVFHQDMQNSEYLCNKAKLLCDSKLNSYTRGGNYWSDFENLDLEFKPFVYSQEVNLLYSKAMNCPIQNICITYENNSEAVTRNNYLHFDRARSFKVFVYLSDVDEGCGPFSIVEGSHNKGAELRRAFASEKHYEEKRNRIDIDYPEIEYNITPILGPAGTTILFDSDIFHKGGNVTENGFRCIIRSHWFGDARWRSSS